MKFAQLTLTFLSLLLLAGCAVIQPGVANVGIDPQAPDGDVARLTLSSVYLCTIDGIHGRNPVWGTEDPFYDQKEFRVKPGTHVLVLGMDYFGQIGNSCTVTAELKAGVHYIVSPKIEGDLWTPIIIEQHPSPLKP